MKITILLFGLVLMITSCKRKEQVSNEVDSSRHSDNYNQDITVSNSNNKKLLNNDLIRQVSSSKNQENEAVSTLNENRAKDILSHRTTSQFEEASKQFGELLQEKSFIGKSLSEVELEFGDPDVISEKFIGYRFDGGFGGWDWIIYHDKKHVTGFSRKGVD